MLKESWNKSAIIYANGKLKQECYNYMLMESWNKSAIIYANGKLKQGCYNIC